MYTCIYTCIYIYIYIRVYIYAQQSPSHVDDGPWYQANIIGPTICTHTYFSKQNIYIYICTYIQLLASICMCIYTYIYTYIYNIYKCIYIYIYMYTYFYMNIHVSVAEFGRKVPSHMYVGPKLQVSLNLEGRSLAICMFGLR